MVDAENAATPGARTVETALEDYFLTLDAGGTINTLRWVLVDGEQSFLTFCHEEGIESVDGIDTQAMRQWGLRLQERTRNGEIAASTAHNYFAYTRAFLEFCVRDRLKETNPAKTDRAKEYLPEDTEQRNRQFWTMRPGKRSAASSSVALTRPTTTTISTSRQLIGIERS